MKQVVALVQRQTAAFLLKRAKTGEVDGPASSVWRKKVLEKRDHFRRVVPQNRLQPVGVGASPGNTSQDIFAGPVRHVFVHPKLRPLLREQKLPVLCGKLKRRLAEKEDFATLKHLAI